MNKLLHNEQQFARANHEVTRAASQLLAHGFPADYNMQLYCECANKACAEHLAITFHDYRQIKQDNIFVIKPEHYLPEFELLLKQTPTYWVISKRLDKLGKDFEV